MARSPASRHDARASDGFVNFGYVGQRTADIARDIAVGHVRWFHRIAERLGERQIVEGLAARQIS